MKYLITLLMLLAFAPITRAEDLGREGNGGDPLALEFQQVAADALKELVSFPELKAKLGNANIDKIFDGITILVVDTPLIAEKDGVEQVSAVMNFPAEKKILINRAAWAKLSDKKLKKALALHEMLGLLGIESTGAYPVSRSYLNQSNDAPALEDSYFKTLGDWSSQGVRVSFAEVNRTVSTGRCFYRQSPDKPMAFIMGGIESRKNNNAGPGLPNGKVKKLFFTMNDIIHPATYDKFPRSNGHDYSWDYKYYDWVSQESLGARYFPVQETQNALVETYDQDIKADGVADVQITLVKYNDYYVGAMAHISKPEEPFAMCYTFRTVQRK